MTDPVLHFDTETRSMVDLKKAGLHRYAEDPTTQCLLMSWRIGKEGPINRWRPGQPLPAAFVQHIVLGLPIVGHNIPFDREIWNKVIRRQYPDAPIISIEQCSCTMARGQALALPASLDQMSYALGTKIQKDRDGHLLMMRMCKPRSIDDNGNPVWFEEAHQLDRLHQYCDQDVETETLIDEIVPPLSASEQKVYHQNQRVNERGISIDIPMVRKALAAVTEATKRADERMWWLTDGEVKKCTEVAKLVRWLTARGVQCESVAKGEIEDLVLKSQILSDPTAEEAIALRRAAAKSSTAKFKSMLACYCEDGRVRGTTAYHGAGTGREAGRLIQPQNFMRVDADRDLPDVLRTLKIMENNWTASQLVDAIEMVVGEPMNSLAKCMRAMIIAGPGMKFVGGDFSNIEGRINAWIAGETWKVQAFRDYDAGTGPDLYTAAYARAFNFPIEAVTGPERQIGKVMELALGFQGGAGAFVSMAAVYGLKTTEDEAEGLKLAWREAHPQIVKSWWDYQDAAIQAVGAPGIAVQCAGGRVRYLAANGFLFCSLPSRRVLAYAAPRLIKVQMRNGGERYQVEYDGIDSFTKKWGPQRLYGGLQCNNIVQGTARDVMMESEFRAEAVGYPVVLKVHDELLTEVPENNNHFNAKDLQKLMSILPPWAAGLPIVAKAWEDKRYVK